MKHILNQTGALLLFLLLLYGLLLVISLPLASRPGSGNLDTAMAASSVFMTEPKYAFLSRSALDSTEDKTILVGASNVLVGFRPTNLQSLTPGASVHNLAIGGANMTEVRQMVDLILEAQSPAARRHNQFVIGIWYGLFVDNRVRWHTPDRHPGDTDLDIERYRYGFYRRTANGPVALLPPHRLDDGVTLITPFLMLDQLARDAAQALRLRRNAVSGQPPASVPSIARQRQYLEFWNTYMGGSGQLAEAQFDELLTTIDTILATGGRVLIVDLPLPRWHASGSPYEAAFRERWPRLLPQLVRPGGAVHVLSLHDADHPEHFADEVHPTAEVAKGWSARLATALNGLPGPAEPLHPPPAGQPSHGAPRGRTQARTSAPKKTTAMKSLHPDRKGA